MLQPKRDHIFISYAWEDVALAEWLARKLLAAGYAVWIDRFKILGGNIWPDDIDDAIKNRTFRMVHLLSRHSLRKENPSKERQLALTIGKKRNEKFLIPLNVDKLTPEELPWQLTDIQYIPFDDWAGGLQQLFETLEAVECPRPLAGTGQDLAIKSHFPIEAIREAPETLYSNCYRVLRVPDVVQKWKSGRPFSWEDAQRNACSKWPCFRINDNLVLAFDQPPDDLTRQYEFRPKEAVCWPEVRAIDSVDSRNLAKSLVQKSLFCVAARRGLTFHQEGKYWYFTPQILEDDRSLYFRSYTGKHTYVKACGERKIFGEMVKYFLAFRINLRDDILDSFTFQVKIRLHLRDSNNTDLEASKVPSRRKAITGNWWNHEWYLRQKAIISFLAEKKEQFSWGCCEKTAVVFSAMPYCAEVPFSLDDEYINSLKTAGKPEEEIKQAIIEEEVAEASKE